MPAGGPIDFAMPRAQTAAMKSPLLPIAAMLLVLCATPAAGQTGQAAAASNGRVGIAVSASTLGVSLDAAIKVHDKANLRVGGNLLSLSDDFDIEDIAYRTSLTMRSVHAYLDWFPTGGGFHISPGLLLHNGNKAGLTATIQAGDEINIDDTTYVSSSSNPIQARGQVTFKSFRPALVIGWGNMIPRSRRVSVPFQIGVVFQGAPTATMAFTGTACASDGTNCRNMATDPTIQAHIKAEEAQFNDDIRVFRFYPVLSIGIGIRF